MRGRGAGCAAVLLMVLAGCGEGEEQVPSAAGVDGDVDPGRRFTGAELKSALLPAKATGPRAKATDVGTGGFNRGYGGGDWGACDPGDEASAELSGMRGTSAGQTILPFPGAIADEGDPVLSQTLVSMPDARAGRHVELRRQLHKACPSVTVDTDAAPVVEHHAVDDLPDLGDEAILESKRCEGGDDHDAETRYYKVEVRVGGVLVLVDAGPHKDRAISLATKAAARVRTELYKAS
ncbi:hypothetical protein [Streptomyces sp. NPDC055243]|uniref:hypothetical protein n=1 Tax=Streptomyces sp. NPDC055243 TaxID=3365720 RepID=UPI0037CE0CEA